MGESVLHSVVDLLYNVKQLAVNAGNPALTINERGMLRAELDASYRGIDGVGEQYGQ